MYSRRKLFQTKPSRLIRELIQWPYETGDPPGADTPINLTWRISVAEAELAVNSTMWSEQYKFNDWIKKNIFIPGLVGRNSKGAA